MEQNLKNIFVRGRQQILFNKFWIYHILTHVCWPKSLSIIENNIIYNLTSTDVIIINNKKINLKIVLNNKLNSYSN